MLRTRFLLAAASRLGCQRGRAINSVSKPCGVCQHIHLFRQHISHDIAKITFAIVVGRDVSLSLFFPLLSPSASLLLAAVTAHQLISAIRLPGRVSSPATLTTNVPNI